MIYQNPGYYYPYAIPYNSTYIVPPVGTNSQYTVPINTNQPYYLPMTQPPSTLTSENIQPNVSVPTTAYAMSSLIQHPTASQETSLNQQKSDSSSNQQDGSSSSEYPQPIIYTSNPSQNYR